MNGVVLVRHGIAQDRALIGEGVASDAERALTPEGLKKLKRAAKGLKELVKGVEIVASSPYRRAVETAEVIAATYRDARLRRLDALLPGAEPEKLMDWLRDNRVEGNIVLVGHEPTLGEWASWALSGQRHSFMPLKKGGACCLEFAEQIGPGLAALHWALSPRQLRGLG